MNENYIAFCIFLLLLCWLCWHRFRKKVGGKNGTYNFVYDSAPKKVYPDIIRLFFFVMIFMTVNHNAEDPSQGTEKGDTATVLCVFGIALLALVLLISVYRKFVFRRALLAIVNYRARRKKERLKILNDPNIERLNLEYRHEVLRNTEEIAMYAVIDATMITTVLVLSLFAIIPHLQKLIGDNPEISFKIAPSELRKCLYVSLVFHVVFTLGHVIWVIYQIKGSRDKGKSIASKFIQSETDY